MARTPRCAYGNDSHPSGAAVNEAARWQNMSRRRREASGRELGGSGRPSRISWMRLRFSTSRSASRSPPSSQSLCPAADPIPVPRRRPVLRGFGVERENVDQRAALLAVVGALTTDGPALGTVVGQPLSPTPLLARMPVICCTSSPVIQGVTRFALRPQAVAELRPQDVDFVVRKRRRYETSRSSSVRWSTSS
jgi:hypothetical protein